MILMMRILLSLSLTTSVLAHSHVDEIWAPNPSVHYKGWNPNKYDTTPYPNNTPGWYTTNRGGDPLYPIHLSTPSIICANGSSSANISAPITAGQTVRVRWWNPGPWPSSHKGPVINYIAACNDSCVGVDATKLRFVKISEKGWIDSSMEEGYWAADELRQDDSSWNITIPKSLKSGAYVLRTEIIALHQAHLAVGNGTDSPVGAEFYPQCISLKVAGNGTRAVEGGVDARKLYRGDEKGIAYRSLHERREHGDYVIPGPRVWDGA